MGANRDCYKHGAFSGDYCRPCAGETSNASSGMCDKACFLLSLRMTLARSMESVRVSNELSSTRFRHLYMDSALSNAYEAGYLAGRADATQMAIDAMVRTGKATTCVG